MSGFPGLEVFSVDGCDYFAVRRAGAAAVDWVRSGRGVGLVHAKVTRPFSHSAADTQSKYRSVDDLADEARHDPLDLFAAALVRTGALSPDEVDEIKGGATRLAADAARAALAATAAGSAPSPTTSSPSRR